jgi:hypothetical protein
MKWFFRFLAVGLILAGIYAVSYYGGKKYGEFRARVGQDAADEILMRLADRSIKVNEKGRVVPVKQATREQLAAAVIILNRELNDREWTLEEIKTMTGR